MGRYLGNRRARIGPVKRSYCEITVGLLALAIVVAGCSAAKNEPKKAPSSKGDDEPAQRIGTGGISVLSRDKERSEVWRANAETAQVSVDPNGAITAQMQGVTGDVYDKGEAAARFRSKQGFAEQKTQVLRLQGDVVLSDRAQLNRIMGDRLEWLPEIKMMQLKGNVAFRGKRFNTSKLDTIWAAPDLNDVGTPQSYKNDPKMKALIAPLLATLAISQGTFSDEMGNMRLTFSTWRATKVNDETTHFVVTGTPATGTWRSQGLNMKARTIEGNIKQGAGGKSILSKANLAGEVRTEMKRTEKGLVRSSVLTSDQADFTGDEKTGSLALRGPVILTSALVNGNQWMQMTGTAGTFKLAIGASQPIEAAEITGPVTLRLINKRRNKQGALETTDLAATGRRLTFNSSAQEIELTGGVVVTGKGPDLVGRMEGEKFRVILDAQGFVKEVYAEGNPGQASGRQP